MLLNAKSSSLRNSDAHQLFLIIAIQRLILSLTFVLWFHALLCCSQVYSVLYMTHHCIRSGTSRFPCVMIVSHKPTAEQPFSVTPAFVRT